MNNLRAKLFKNSKAVERTVIFLLLSFAAFIALCVCFYTITTQNKYARILCYAFGGLYLLLIYCLEKKQKAKETSYALLAASAVECWNALHDDLNNAGICPCPLYEYAETEILKIIMHTKDSIIKAHAYIDINEESNSKADLCLLILYCCINKAEHYDGIEQYYKSLIEAVAGTEKANNYPYNKFSQLKTADEKISFVNSAYKAVH